jgi:hypothetical protein
LKKPSDVEISVSILLYSGKSNKVGKIVQIIIDRQASREPVEIFSTTEDLSTRLRRRKGDLIIVILLISSQKELIEFFLIRDLLVDIPIILILPDRKKETIHLGHKLCPRFLSYIDGNFSDVALVLNKMMRNACAKEKSKIKGMLPVEAKPVPTVPHPNRA